MIFGRRSILLHLSLSLSSHRVVVAANFTTSKIKNSCSYYSMEQSGILPFITLIFTLYATDKNEYKKVRNAIKAIYC